MGKLSDLLRYKAEVPILDLRTNKEVAKVWVRLLGDEDLKEAFRHARIASSNKRRALKLEDSVDTLDDRAQLAEQPITDLIDIIVAARENGFANDATVVVDREDLPEIASLAKLPDAPSLEEQERLDTLIEEQQKNYEERVNEYIQTRITQLRAELAEMSLDEIVKIASEELINIKALQEFVDELNDQKIYRGTFDDERCKTPSFSSIEDSKNASTGVRQQILAAYNSLEMAGEEIKN